MTSLEEHMEAAYDVDIDEQISVREWDQAEDRPTDLPQRFIVDDEGKADWALRKLAKYREQQERNRDLATLEIERVTAWLDEQNAVLQEREAFFASLLVEFHQSLLAADPKRKTVKLPMGTLKARKGPDRVSIEDTDSFIEWARVARPELVRTSYAAAMNVIREAAIKDGEILPGVEVVAGSVNFSIAIEGGPV